MVSIQLRALTEQMLDEIHATGWWTTREGKRVRITNERPTAWDINDGRCEEWGERALRIVGGEGFWLDNFIDVDQYPVDDMPPIDHYVLRLEGRFYDSQHPDGVDDVMQLDFVRGVTREEFLAK